MKQDVQHTYKSNDTEEWLDRVFTRPIGYLWAKFFERLGVHPNIVTVLSIVIGITSAFFFLHGSWRTEGRTGLVLNVIGILLMMWANFYDSADGQLARMTGKKTQLGRILDGAASIIIFIPVYCALVWRCYQYHSMEFQWLQIADTERNAVIYGLTLFAVCLFSGFVCHSGQCRLADYYRQIHLFFLNALAWPLHREGLSQDIRQLHPSAGECYSCLPASDAKSLPQIRKGRQCARVVPRQVPPLLTAADAAHQHPHVQHACHSPLSMLPH